MNQVGEKDYKSRDRVLTSLEHEEPDKIPFDLASTKVTGITKNAYINLLTYLGKDLREVKSIKFFDVTQQLVEVKEGILNQLGVDIRGLMPNVVRKNPHIEDHKNFQLFTDEWGMTYKMPKKKGYYFDLIKSPLSGDIKEKDIDDFPWPDPTDPHLLQGLKSRAEKFYNDGYAVILESLGAGIFEMSCRIRGYEEFFSDLIINPKLACKLMDKFLELKIQFYEVASQQVGKYVQFVREGDDVAGQDSLLISPDIYRKYVKPRHKELFEAQRKIFPDPFYVFFHSDGAVYGLISDFIEIGVDILNPVQTNVRGMDIKRLKKIFGNEIVFWGAGINTQETLPKANPDKVKQEVRERIEILAPGGGFIFNTVHNIQDDVPPENIMAMWETLQELGDY